MAHKHEVYESGGHFLINLVTREVTPGSSAKIILAQHDHNSKRFTFEIPRYIDGHDMSLCDLVQVHYINIDAKTRAFSADVYDVTDVQVSPDDDNVVICSWLISGTATVYAGSLSFSIRWICTGDGGSVDYSLGSIKYTAITVLEDVHNGDIIAEEYSDIIAAWEARISEMEDTVVRTDDYEEQIRQAVEFALQTAKDSGEFDGTSVSVKSVSESTEDGGNNVVTFSDGNTLTVKNGKTGAVGPKGTKGDKGDTGATGPKGDKGDTGTSVSVRSVSESTEDGGNNVVTFSDGNTLTVKNGKTGSAGPKGDTGAKGDKGDTGAAGPKGDKGDKGDTGAAGPKGDKGDIGTSVTVTSVVESTEDGGSNVVTFSDGNTLTVKNGKTGTSVSVKSVSESTEDGGSNVVTFSDENTLTVKNGKTGSAGAPGKSAYAYAQDGGYTGTEEEFAQKLAGESAGTVEVDATLTQEGKAADAKAVGDTLANKAKHPLHLNVAGFTMPLTVTAISETTGKAYTLEEIYEESKTRQITLKTSVTAGGGVKVGFFRYSNYSIFIDTLDYVEFVGHYKDVNGKWVPAFARIETINSATKVTITDAEWAESSVETDSTLTKDGFPANAKTVGDKLAELSARIEALENGTT